MTIENQIESILAYLKIDGNFDMMGVGIFQRDKQQLTLAYPDIDLKWALYHIFSYLQDQCRKKALEKWVDIELANAELLWCCYEINEKN